MAARKARGRSGARKKAGSSKPDRRSKRTSTKRPTARKAAPRKSTPKAAAPKRARKAAPTKRGPKAVAPTPARKKVARLGRERRILGDDTLQTPPSSLNMERHGSAVRTGRAERAQSLTNHATMTPEAITAGDPDVSVEDAYFAGEEAPGGDNPTPGQDAVDDIGKALGVEYQDAEELRSGDKVADRDKHRWELDPASSEDYRNRK